MTLAVKMKPKVKVKLKVKVEGNENESESESGSGKEVRIGGKTVQTQKVTVSKDLKRGSCPYN